MGISGLMKFMKLNNCCELVRLSDIADAYRNKTGKDPVLLVDFSSAIPHLYTSSPGIKAVSGELKKFLENLKTFVSNSKDLGIEIKFFKDGKRPSHKYNIWVEQLSRKLNLLKRLYSNQTVSDSELSGRDAVYLVASNCLFMEENCKLSRAIYEADDDIMKYVKTEECFAILTNDSDFFVLNNIHYCLTSENSNLESMTFFNFNKSNLARLLKIHASQLPLFASLCLSQFELSSEWLEVSKEKEICVKHRFFEVANFIKNFTSKEEMLECIFSLRKTNNMTNLERRLEFYSGEAQEDARHTAQNHWERIVNFAEKRHIADLADHRILSIIQDKVQFCGPTCENIFMPLPDYAPIHKKIYGILFFEHPDPLIFVTHFSYECLEKGSVFKHKVSTIIVDRRSHPGLLELWSLKNSESLRTSRLTVFCQAIHNKLTAKDFLSLNIPVEYVFPILIAFYFLWELDKKFNELEVETLLIQAVLVNRLTAEQIDQLPEEFHLEVLNLIGSFLSMVNPLNLLNSVCGEPFCRYKTNLSNFFDGKVMNYVYGKMKEEENLWMSFSEFQKEFETLISVLYKLGRLCDHV